MAVENNLIAPCFHCGNRVESIYGANPTVEVLGQPSGALWFDGSVGAYGSIWDSMSQSLLVVICDDCLTSAPSERLVRVVSERPKSTTRIVGFGMSTEDAV